MSSDWIAPAGAAAAVVSSGSERTPSFFFMLAFTERARCLGITLLVKRVPPSRCFPGLLKQTLRLSLRFPVCLVVSVWFLVLDTYINTHTHTLVHILLASGNATLLRGKTAIQQGKALRNRMLPCIIHSDWKWWRQRRRQRRRGCHNGKDDWKLFPLVCFHGDNGPPMFIIADGMWVHYAGIVCAAAIRAGGYVKGIVCCAWFGRIRPRIRLERIRFLSHAT